MASPSTPSNPPPPLHLDLSPPSTRPESAVPASPRRSYPAIAHFAVISAVILPLTLIPYIFTRRQLSLLRQTVRELETSSTLIRKDLHTSVSDLGKVRDDVRRMRALLHEVMEEAELLRADVQAGEVSQKAADEATQSNLQRLVDQARKHRSHGESLRSLGTSLADIAAFMHEMELRMSFFGSRDDSSRVEHMRQVALKLQNLPVENEDTKENVERHDEQNATN
ncbi:hypothetical protein V5O48_000017 [Marasmius crinis-equi]|uniref:Uncharacterized protein n=1 Tax=Marasmius crinis-equi TaxID=585013 RepID=A0ABR3G395_9AGAR